MDFGSVANAIVRVENRAQALALQDLAAERCTMPYRAPELFDVKSQCTIDEKVDVWVGYSFLLLLVSLFTCPAPLVLWLPVICDGVWGESI